MYSKKKKKNTLRPKLPPSRVRAEQSTAGQGWYCIIGNPIVATGSLLSAKEAEEEKQGALTLHHLWMWIDLSVWIQRTSVVKYVLIIRCSKVADSKITLTLYLATYTNGVKKKQQLRGVGWGLSHTSVHPLLFLWLKLSDLAALTLFSLNDAQERKTFCLFQTICSQTFQRSKMIRGVQAVAAFTPNKEETTASPCS